MTAHLTIEQAAQAEGVSAAAMRSRIRRNPAAVVRRGRGRGDRTLVDLDALRGTHASVKPQTIARDLAMCAADLLADAAWQTFIACSGPHKRPLIAELIGMWYRGTTMILDELRRIDPTVPDVIELPAKLVALRRIYDDFAKVRERNTHRDHDVGDQ